MAGPRMFAAAPSSFLSPGLRRPAVRTHNAPTGVPSASMGARNSLVESPLSVRAPDSANVTTLPSAMRSTAQYSARRANINNESAELNASVSGDAATHDANRDSTSIAAGTGVFFGDERETRD